jgi:hypothetical protein
VFVFEGPQVEWIVDDLVDNPFHSKVRAAFERWRSIVDGPPRIAREQFGWGVRDPVPSSDDLTVASAT